MNDLTAALAALPRLSLGHFPTPLDEAPRLSKRLGARVLIKRDDQTGLALGGNKVRKLEFLIADALRSGADTIVTTGGSQSNHARLAAAACRRAGLACHLVLDRGVHPEEQGNLLLDELLGAQVLLIESQDPEVAMAEMQRLASDLASTGRKPYVIPRGGSVPAGASGYAAFVPELLAQLADRDLDLSALYLATGSCGTHSGVMAGRGGAGATFRVQGVSVSRPEALQRAKIAELSAATLKHLRLDATVCPDDIAVDDRFRGPGYGIPTEGTMEAVEIAARDEGIILDPVYTGKAMAGLLAHAREGRFARDDTIVFLHTGGAPALFAYHRETANAVGRQ